MNNLLHILFLLSIFQVGHQQFQPFVGLPTNFGPFMYIGNPWQTSFNLTANPSERNEYRKFMTIEFRKPGGTTDIELCRIQLLDVNSIPVCSPTPTPTPSASDPACYCKDFSNVTTVYTYTLEINVIAKVEQNSSELYAKWASDELTKPQARQLIGNLPAMYDASIATVNGDPFPNGTQISTGTGVQHLKFCVSNLNGYSIKATVNGKSNNSSNECVTLSESFAAGDHNGTVVFTETNAPNRIETLTFTVLAKSGSGSSDNTGLIVGIVFGIGLVVAVVLGILYKLGILRCTGLGDCWNKKRPTGSSDNGKSTDNEKGMDSMPAKPYSEVPTQANY